MNIYEMDVYEKIADILKSELKHLKTVIIFGSHATGTAGAQSDIDVAFLSEDEISSVKRWELQEGLASELNADIDLIDLKSASDVFKFQVILGGTVVYSQDKVFLERYVDNAYAMYLQLNEDRQPILNDIKNGRYYA